MGDTSDDDPVRAVQAGRDDARFGARVGEILDEDGELRERLADGPEAEVERVKRDEDLMATLRRPAVRDREILDGLAE